MPRYEPLVLSSCIFCFLFFRLFGSAWGNELDVTTVYDLTMRDHLGSANENGNVYSAAVCLVIMLCIYRIRKVGVADMPSSYVYGCILATSLAVVAKQ